MASREEIAAAARRVLANPEAIRIIESIFEQASSSKEQYATIQWLQFTHGAALYRLKTRPVSTPEAIVQEWAAKQETAGWACLRGGDCPRYGNNMGVVGAHESKRGEKRSHPCRCGSPLVRLIVAPEEGR